MPTLKFKSARRVPVNTPKNPNGIAVVLTGEIDGASADVFIGFAPKSVSAGVTAAELAVAGIPAKAVFADAPIVAKSEIPVHIDTDESGTQRWKISTELSGKDALARLAPELRTALGL